jgi:hypothetical protein
MQRPKPQGLRAATEGFGIGSATEWLAGEM